MAATDLHDRLSRAKDLIDRHYASPLDLRRLAREACFSRFHFIRAFRTVFRKTPHQYLKDRRIARAKELLADGPLPVTDICFEVGFHSLGSFSSLFRKLVGQSPAAYRARMLALRVETPVFIPACFLAMHGVTPRPGAAQIRNS